MTGMDFKYFMPEVYQAVAGKNHIVYAFMNDGSIRLVNMEPFIKEGGVFEALKDDDFFTKKLTVMNNTVAWDAGGNRDEYKCIDIDPIFIYNDCQIVSDIDEPD